MVAVFQDGTPPDRPAEFNLADYVLSAGAPSATALEVVGDAGAETWSYAALRAAVFGAARGLTDHGLLPGDHLLLRLGNTPDFPVAYLAAIAAGLVPVVTSAQWTAREVAAAAARVAPTCAIQSPHLPAAEGVAQITLDRFRALYDLPPRTPDMGSPERPAYIVFTSGTSGQPRAVLHAQRAILARQMMMRDWYDLRAGDRMCHAGAFNWTYTLGTGLLDPWTLGASAVIPAPGTDPADLPQLLAAHGATLFAAAPGVVRRMLRASDWPHMPDLRHGLVAGEKLPETVRARWRDVTGTELYEAFGMSECSTFISGAPGRPTAQGTLGRPQRGRRVALIGPDGPVTHGIEAEIAVHRSDPGLMLGYFGDPEGTAARFQGDWFCTGDRGQMDADGQITYLGRSDDMITAGGYRVSPVEVEEVMATHHAITDCAAIELRVGPETTLVALGYTGTPCPPEALAAFAETRLARYKQPRVWHHVPALPRGANGKLLRRALRAQLETPT